MHYGPRDVCFGHTERFKNADLPRSLGNGRVHCQQNYQRADNTGDANDDVFILVDGELEVGTLRAGQFKRFDVIRSGEVFGEMAFFTREPRNATVRAVRPAECLVLKGSDLRLLAFDHPSILMQMAGVLARRLANFIKTKADSPDR